jgi:CHASE2 domain-containing sensor protein
VSPRKSSDWLESSLTKRTLGYVAVIAGCFGAGMLAAWSPIAVRINHYAYDLMTIYLQPAEAWTPQSVVVAIDEATLDARGGRRRIRAILAEALEKIAAAKPLAVTAGGGFRHYLAGRRANAGRSG